MQHRTCDQVGEIRHEERVRNEPRLAGLALAGIDEKRDLREREE
jgi:hypothetical protein